ncbi:hypothetical protein [Streptomyces sp. DH10]|uniref:hypothetical protein n=1 Tax=Streptomyces sp. DH10 TaxID=3040121 RepID=UPI002443282F|nr:hypothetical protein [Streptomyces sp. DH10]MDG9709521.1 hypothetical protein [Streptomyces sp. DH10]
MHELPKKKAAKKPPAKKTAPKKTAPKKTAACGRVVEGGHHEQVRGGFVVGTRVHGHPRPLREVSLSLIRNRAYSRLWVQGGLL